MRMNVKNHLAPVFTHEGARAYPLITAEQRLRRSVLSCLLWEDTFYEDGKSIADRIVECAKDCSVNTVSNLCIEARSEFNLRHAPLLLLTALIANHRGNSIVGDTIPLVIQRADELAELVSIYWRNGKRPLSAQMKKGLARAFTKFNAYALAKYNRDDAVKLRDVLFLCHAKPKDQGQADVWKKLVEGTLESPDTWEVKLSGGADKKETFERLIREDKLGYLALLRNLRNMAQAGCDMVLVRDAILARKGGAERVLPFRYIAAARACPQMEPYLDQALLKAISDLPYLHGKTAVLVDVSGSMDGVLSGKSDMTRMDAAAALASVIHGDVRVFTFSEKVVEVPPRRGMAGVDAIIKSQSHGGTYLGNAVTTLNQTVNYDRLIVVTDEQSHDSVPAPIGKSAYLINVASYQNGVGYGPWIHIDGFSEQVLRFITELEASNTEMG